MILKERDEREHQDADKFSQAGAKAEAQMAFYLKRAFGDDPEVWVFNDLRYKATDNDVAQIDHLVLHRSGFILIESKSVTSKVRIHANGEWERLWNNHWQGMPSPVKQVERQAEFLRNGLQPERDKLLGKMLFGQIQMGFRKVPFEVLVAISDTGSIDRKGKAPEVAKADLIPDRVREIVARHRKARSLFSPTNLNLKSYDGIFNFKDEEMEALRRWLIDHHYPRSLEVAVAAAEQEQSVHESPASYASCAPQSSPVVVPNLDTPPGTGFGKCQKCGLQSEILWGKFGYYWRCLSCGSNTPIKEYCPTCREKLKLRKDKEKFFKHCDRCNTESLYYHAIGQPRPIEPANSEPPHSTVEVSESCANDLGACPKCGTQGEILWGKFGYYWKCRSCDTNSPIKEFCPRCRGKMKLRKDKNRFFKYCEPCNTDSLYHEVGQSTRAAGTNPS